ncbi:cupredoxin domain-containing protein [Paraglaciecola sp.]|uniref:cupredoxin domain-containing protein n=1 Tax=Paraglaciecola sp. TaxID=1920173 RepID=UPI003EF659DE
MIVINIIGLVLIAIIVWWFWLYKPQETVVENNEIMIEVKNGVYSPALIQVAADRPILLKFFRNDQTPCSETLLFPSLEISEQLKLNEITQVNIKALIPGEYEFHCQMKMYHGVLKVI